MYLEQEEYQAADRKGKVRVQAANQPQRLPKNSDTRRAVFELMRFYDSQLEARGLVSFNTMRVLALEQARKQPLQKFTHIIVDESQDLTRSQLLFLKEIQNPKSYGSILFIGDYRAKHLCPILDRKRPQLCDHRVQHGRAEATP